MDDMKSKFELILDKDEEIKEVFKPNKLKLYFRSLLWSTLSLLFFCGIAILSILFPDTDEFVEPLWVILPIGIFVVFEALNVLFIALYYKNVFYAYTNKRVIIRTGIFGVDFKSLDMSMIGAIDVYVSLLDKILRKNTGSIRFGSTSSPMSGQGSVFMFANITNPYESYKIIKSFIDEYKTKKLESEK